MLTLWFRSSEALWTMARAAINYKPWKHFHKYLQTAISLLYLLPALCLYYRSIFQHSMQGLHSDFSSKISPLKYFLVMEQGFSLKYVFIISVIFPHINVCNSWHKPLLWHTKSWWVLFYVRSWKWWAFSAQRCGGTPVCSCLPAVEEGLAPLEESRQLSSPQGAEQIRHLVPAAASFKAGA